MEVAIRAAQRVGRRVQGAMCYALSPVHDIPRWLALARGLADLGVDAVVVKDTSGLLSPRAARALVAALTEAVDLPVVVHSHCSTGMAPMAYLAAAEAGAAVLDTAMSPLAWGASQPATESVVAALAGGERDTGLDLGRLVEIKLELEELRRRHRDDVSPGADRVDSEVLRYQMPSFMLEDIHRQLDQHGALERLREALDEVPRVREELGFPPLVAPVRQVVASQAVYNVLGGDRYATVSQELKDYLQGLYGMPPSPADAEVRRLVLGQDEPITLRPADLLEPQVDTARVQLQKRGLGASDEDVLTYLLFPAAAAELLQARLRPAAPAEDPEAETQVLTTEQGEGAVAADGSTAPAPPEPPEPPEPAPAPVAGEFEVEVEGEVFRVRVAGVGVAVLPAGAAAAPPAAPAPAARRPRDGAIAAPMQGLIVKVPVKVGDQIKLGDVVAVLEAMKMQNDIVATQPGRVLEIYVKEGEVVTPNQPLVAIG